MELPFLTLDVFTTTRYEGNPLGVVLLPHDKKLSQEQKQRIAAEFNLSETVIIHEQNPDTPGDEWRVDIFMTTAELPFAGHPTIGSANFLLGRAGITQGTLLLKAGRTPISNVPNVPGAVMAEVAHNIHVHSKTFSNLASGTDGLQGFSKVPAVAKAEAAAPLVAIVKGMNFLLVKLDSLEQLAQATPSVPDIELSMLADEEWKTGFFGKYYYVLQGGENQNGDTVEVQTRMIEGSLEDPATGSAASALCSWLALNGQGKKFQITQGVEMGRKSIIGVDVDLEVGADKVKSVRLSGKAVEVMKGTIQI